MKSNYDENIFNANKDKIYNGEVDNSYRTMTPDEEYIDIFGYENLALEYNFKTGQTALYLQKSESNYEILYESHTINGIESASFYSEDTVYMLTGYNHNTGDISNLNCVPKKDFIKSANRFNPNSNRKIVNSIKTFGLTTSILMHTTNLIVDNTHIKSETNKKYFKEYRKLFVKYCSATALIPISNILEETISNLNEFIATRKLDISKFKKICSELENFKEVCGSSISLLSSFINNPYTTDLRNLSDSLSKNLHNVDNLINLYLEDELILQDKEKNNDSK